MVTASYVSEAMRELDSRVKEAGITILNEVCPSSHLNPQLDHPLVRSA
jgi:hypothetical protein